MQRVISVISIITKLPFLSAPLITDVWTDHLILN